MTSHKRIVTGVINKTVVTLSKNDERTAVKKHKQLINGHVFPLVIYTWKMRNLVVTGMAKTN